MATGEPFLPDDPDLHFNLSHSNGLAHAVRDARQGVRVGCDHRVAQSRTGLPAASPSGCSRPPNVPRWQALPPEQWVAGFYNCWTRKEAFVKALGLGLSYPLDAFTVSVAPGELARLIAAGRAGH